MKTKETLNIVIVDNDPLTGKIYSEHMNKMGYEQVSVLTTHPDCINQVCGNADIIFLEQQMMICAGRDIMKEYKFRNPNAYIVIISAQTNLRMVVAAFREGAFDYIIKGEKDLEMIRIVLREIHLSLVIASEKKSLNEA